MNRGEQTIKQPSEATADTWNKGRRNEPPDADPSEWSASGGQSARSADRVCIVPISAPDIPIYQSECRFDFQIGPDFPFKFT